MTFFIRLLLYIVLCQVFTTPFVFAQKSFIPKISLEFQTYTGGGTNLPFWMVSGQYGKYNLDKSGLLGSVILQSRPYTLSDWELSYGAEGIARLTKRSELWLHQGYVRVDYRKFIRLQAGWKEETFGNQYTPLSSGSTIWSGNARPMPKIEIGSAGYLDVPFTKGTLQVKGSIAHGWFEEDRYVKGVMLHQKYATARTRFDFPLNFNFTFHHFAMWGGNHPVYEQLPKDFDAFLTVFLIGKGGGNAPQTDQLNRYGNHIGSRSFGIDFKQALYEVNFYFQDIFEDGSGARWKNFPDGLWGMVWKNSNTAAPLVAVLYEYLHTIDQSGPVHQAIGLPGDDNYFNNVVYLSGWTNNKMIIGTPFITSPMYYQHIEDSPNYRMWNNRVVVHHIGIQGNIIKNISYKMKASFAQNLGLHSSMMVPDDIYNLEKPQKQWHWIVDLGYEFNNPVWSLNLKLASDTGRLYGNNFSGMIGFKYLVL